METFWSYFLYFAIHEEDDRKPVLWARKVFHAFFKCVAHAGLFLSKVPGIGRLINSKYLLDDYRKGMLELLGGRELPKAQASVPSYVPDGKKAFYLLHNSLPHDSGGYATRAHGLLTGINRSEWTASAISRLGYPWDSKTSKTSEIKESNDISGVTYRHLEHPLSKKASKVAIYQLLPRFQYLQEYFERVFELARSARPSVMHGASNYFNGWVANRVARAFRIPSVYEVRGFWELTSASRKPSFVATLSYHASFELEARVAQEADLVFTLTRGMKKALINRGVSAEKIELLPNGVDSSRFKPLLRDEALAAQLGVQNKTVIGYVGSVVDYEGLELLPEACAGLLSKKEISPFVFLIVGDGAALDSLKHAIKKFRVEKHFILTGRIPHHEVEKYYSIMDICPLPRLPRPVCELVSPLKPFEAMAMERCLLVSSVDPLLEIVEDGVTGKVFKKGSAQDLEAKLSELIQNPKLREDCGKAARTWVVAERDWSVIARKVSSAYERLSKGNLS